MRMARIAALVATFLFATAAMADAPSLPEGSHIKIGFNPAMLVGKVKEMLDETQKLPIFVKHPQLARQLTAQANLAFTMLSTLSVQMGFDPVKDVEQGWIGVLLKRKGDPDWVMWLSGNLPLGLIDRLPGAGDSVRIKGFKARRMGDEEEFALQPKEGIALFGNRAGIEAALSSRSGGTKPLGAGDMLEVEFAPPRWLVDELHARKDARMFLPLLEGLRRMTLSTGDRLDLVVECDGKARDAWKLVLEGMNEGLIGGHRLLRAYAKFFLALDLTEFADVPPQFRELLADKPALLETLDVLLPPGPRGGKVSVRAQSVEFFAEGKDLAGGTFFAGMIGAVAIPAFINYVRKAKLAEGYENINRLARLERNYYARHKRHLACRQHPRKVPRGEAVAWGKNRCFEKLGFRLEKTYFSYSIRRVGKKGFEIEAKADLDGDGEPVTLRQLSDGGPIERVPPDEW